jgi:hypothetical protein
MENVIVCKICKLEICKCREISKKENKQLIIIILLCLIPAVVIGFYKFFEDFGPVQDFFTKNQVSYENEELETFVKKNISIEELENILNSNVNIVEYEDYYNVRENKKNFIMEIKLDSWNKKYYENEKGEIIDDKMTEIVESIFWPRSSGKYLNNISDEYEFFTLIIKNTSDEIIFEKGYITRYKPTY